MLQNHFPDLALEFPPTHVIRERKIIFERLRSVCEYRLRLSLVVQEIIFLRRTPFYALASSVPGWITERCMEAFAARAL